MKYLGLLLVTAFAAVCLFAFPAHSYAADVFKNTCDSDPKLSQTDTCKDVKTQEGSDKNPIITIMRVAIEIISFIAGAGAVISMIVGGIRFMTAQGDAQQISSARSGIIYSLIGIAVVIFAQVIVIFVLGRVN